MAADFDRFLFAGKFFETFCAECGKDFFRPFPAAVADILRRAGIEQIRLQSLQTAQGEFFRRHTAVEQFCHGGMAATFLSSIGMQLSSAYGRSWMITQ